MGRGDCTRWAQRKGYRDKCSRTWEAVDKATYGWDYARFLEASLVKDYELSNWKCPARTGDELPMSKVSEVSVRVPIIDAVTWEPWLTTELGVQAEKFDLGYDGGEESGKYEVFDFTGEPEQVEQAVVLTLVAHGVHRPVTREGRRVTVAPETGRWLVPLTAQDTMYGKALHRVARELERDERLADWFAGTGLRKVMFHESHRPGQPARFSEDQEDGELLLSHGTDLTIMDGKPSKDEAEKVAREHLREVLEAVAGHLGKPLPV